MSPPTPPSPPIISRHTRDEEEHKISSRSHHRTARDYRASRSRSRGRGRNSRISPERERRHRQRTHSRSRSRDASRFRRRHRPEQSPLRHRYERSPSKSSKVRSERRRRSSHRSRSRSFSKTHRTAHKSKSRSRSHSRSRQHHNRSSRSGSRSHRTRDTRSRSTRHEDRVENSNKKPNVIVLSTESYKDSLKSNSRLPSVREEQPSSSSSSTSTFSKPPLSEETPSWKKAKLDQVGVYSNLEPDAPIDKEKIHKEIEEKLRLVLAREGKVYPYPKPEPSHPVFANDGSFLEIFKKMQQQQTFVQQQVGESMQIHAVPAAPVAPVMPVAPIHQPPPPQLPIFGRRRGGKILKTGVVAKPKSSNDTDSGDVKDFWSIYLREVKKYKSTACESDSKTRPLVR